MNKCKHCGHELEAEYKGKCCPECGGVLAETPTKDVDPEEGALKDVKEAVEAGMKGVKTEIDESLKGVEKRIDALEAAPAAGTKGVAVHVRAEKYFHGRKLDDMGRAGHGRTKSVSQKVADIEKRGGRFSHINTDEGLDDFSKFFVLANSALLARGTNPKIAMELNEFTKELNQKWAEDNPHIKASDLVEGTNNLGGYTVPTILQADFIQLVKDQSFLLQNATVWPMSSNKHQFPSEASRVTAAWIGENSAITASNPTFGQVELEAKKLAGLTGGVSMELLQDSLIDIPSMLADQFSFAMAQELDNQALNGTGDPVSGVLTAAVTSSVVMSGDSFSNVSADDFSLMIARLADADANEAMFIYNRLVQHYVRTLKDTANSPIYQKPGYAGPGREGSPATMWELPIFQSVKAPGTSAASTAFASLGNWKYFYVGDRFNSMSLDVDPYTGFAAGTVRYRMIKRWGLAIARADAFVRLITGA